MAAVLGNPVAQRSVRLLSEAVGGVALMAEGGSAADRERVLGLVLARSAGQALVETLAVHLLLHGNAYVQMVVGADGEGAELFALRPERVRVEADARGWAIGYRFWGGERVGRGVERD